MRKDDRLRQHQSFCLLDARGREKTECGGLN
jgi:hypothetical protein